MTSITTSGLISSSFLILRHRTRPMSTASMETFVGLLLLRHKPGTYETTLHTSTDSIRRHEGLFLSYIFQLQVGALGKSYCTSEQSYT